MMFRALWQNDFSGLARLGEWFHARQQQHPAALLCLDHVFAQGFHLESASLSEIALCFQQFFVYTRSLSRFSCDPNPCSNPHLQRLFAYRPVNGDNEELFLLPKTSYLFLRAKTTVVADIQEGTVEIHIPRWELERLVKAELREVLKYKVWSQNEMCHTMPRLRPCLLFAVTKSCPRRECSQIHVKEPFDEAGVTYNTLVRIHILQIMIFHTLYAAEIEYEELVHQQRSVQLSHVLFRAMIHDTRYHGHRAWLRRLYEALYPYHNAIGSLHLLSLDAVPELIQGRRIIVVWIQDYLNRLSHHRGATHVFLVNLMRTCRLAMLFDRHPASDNLHRIPCAIGYRTLRPPHLLRSGGYFVVNDFLAATQCRDPGALNRGVLFLKYVVAHSLYMEPLTFVLSHVLFNRLRVDIGVLCDFMDYLCSAMLIAINMRTKGTLHDLTLPRSWLAQTLQGIDRLSDMQTDRSLEYVNRIGRLLQEVYTGQDAGRFRECYDSSISLMRLPNYRLPPV